MINPLQCRGFSEFYSHFRESPRRNVIRKTIRQACHRRPLTSSSGPAPIRSLEVSRDVTGDVYRDRATAPLETVNIDLGICTGSEHGTDNQSCEPMTTCIPGRLGHPTQAESVAPLRSAEMLNPNHCAISSEISDWFNAYTMCITMPKTRMQDDSCGNTPRQKRS